MTGNEFNAEYKLGQRIASGTVESYLAHVIATRRLVMVHRLTGASDVERRRINSLVDALPSRATTVLARLDVDGEPVIVTEFLPDFVNLREWLEEAVAVQTTIVIRTGPPPARPPSASPPATTPSAAERADGGEFTRLFGQPLAPQTVPPPLAPPPVVPPPITHRPEPAAGAPSRTPSQTPPAAPPTARSPATPPASATPGPGAGSFTAFFGAALDPSAVAPPPPPAQPTATPAPAAPPPPPFPPPTPAASAPAPATPPRAPRPGSFTELFGAAAPPPADPPITPARAPTAPPRAAPGDFTRMFGAASAPASPPSPQPSFPESRSEPPPLGAMPPVQPSSPPMHGAADRGAIDAPKIRVMWRPRETPGGPPGPMSATSAMEPAPPAPSAGPPVFASPSEGPSPPPFAAPAGPPPMASPPPVAPSAPPYAAPNARQDALDLSLVPRKPEASLGPPELRLFSDESGQRVEPFAPPPAPSSAPAARGSSGPSDFTRMLTPVEAAPVAPPPAAVRPNAKPEAAPAGGRKPSLLPLILVVTFALVAGAALILYFVLRSQGGR